MTPGKYDLALYRGDTYRWSVQLWADAEQTVPVDLTGATVAAEIRDKPSGTKITTLLATLGGPGEIIVELTADNYAAVPANGVWDLQVTYPDGTVRTVLAGKVIVVADVTDSTAAGRSR